MKYCPNCGKAGVEGTRFCPQCGQRLTGFDLGQDQSHALKPGAAKEKAAMGVGYQERQQFKSMKTRTQVLFWILIILMVLDIIAIFSDLAQVDLINRVIWGEAVTEYELIANDSRQAVISFALTALYIAYLIVFFTWIYRANKNLRSLRAAGLRFTPGWAVGWFFVPFMNLFRPYQVVSEIWKASDPMADMADDTSWKAVVTSPIVGCWWALFLVSAFVARIAIQTLFGGIGLSDLLNSTYAYMVSEAIDVVYALTTIFMVRRIGQFQETKNKLISSAF